MPILRTVWTALAVLLLLAQTAGAVVIDGVAAVVNGRVITQSEVAEAAAFKERTGEARGEEARKRALDSLIEKALVEAEAERLGVRVTDEEVEKAICEICDRNSIEREKLPEVLKAQGVDFDAYVQEIRSQIQRMKLAGRVLRAKLDVSDESLREYYLKNVARFREPDMVRLRHLQARTREEAEAARARVLAGEAFEDVARAVSTGPAAASGGDMGFVPVDSLAAPVRRAVDPVEPGGVTQVLEMRGGYHLFYVVEKKKGRVPAFEEVRDRIREGYFQDREQELYRTWIQSLREKARIEVKRRGG